MKRSIKTSITAGTMAILIGLTSFINGLQSAKRVQCELRVDYAHISTYANEIDGVNKLKIKANTHCNRAQKYSTVGMKFFEVTSTGNKEVWVFDSLKVLADKKQPEYAYFESFERFCRNNVVHRYFGEASGQVRLNSGKLIKVSGKSEKYISVPCGNIAQ